MREAFMMGSKIKEDERTEKAIRNLLKLPDNRRCINCNSLGPQYVCSTFWTFVCINCSGIHREFTHRVKSVSMAKFTKEEVSELHAGGNKRARQIYFKEWDTQRDTYPDGSNIFKLRDFIKSVYVDKRYCSESNDKNSKQKMDVIEDSMESSKKMSTKFFGSRSLHFVDKSEFERPSGIGRSGNESLRFYFDEKKHNPKSRGLPKSPAKFEIVDDRFRDDGSVKRYDGRRESRVTSKSLDLSNNNYMSSLPIVRHTSELLGDNAPQLRIDKVVQVEENKDHQLNNQMTTSSSDKMENPRSLIDDAPVSEPTPHSNEITNQTSSELYASVKTSEDPAPNSLEALLFGLTVVPPVENYPAANLETQTMSIIPENVTSFVTSPTTTRVQSPHDDGSSNPMFYVVADNLNTEEMAIPIQSSPKEPSNISMEQLTLDISNTNHGVGLEHHDQDDTKSSIRKALPEDLFAGGFSFASSQVYGQHHGMGYDMQYYQYPVAMGTYTYITKPANPFDLSCDDTSPNQTPQFPSMAYMQGGGLPHTSTLSEFSDSTNLAANSVGLMASQSPFYTTNLSPNSPSPASNISYGAYMGQQSHVPISPSLRRQEINGVVTTKTNINAAHTFHQPNNVYPSANPNAYISRGNPFE